MGKDNNSECHLRRDLAYLWALEFFFGEKTLCSLFVAAILDNTDDNTDDTEEVINLL